MGSPLALADTLPPIVVEATRLASELEEIPAAVSVVHRDELQQGRTLLGFDEALIGVPGVFALNRYNFAQDLRLSIRGFGARSSFGIRGLRIYLDGIPLTGPDGQTSLDDVDPGLLQPDFPGRIGGRLGIQGGLSAAGVLSLDARIGDLAGELRGQPLRVSGDLEPASFSRRAGSSCRESSLRARAGCRTRRPGR